MSAPSDIGIGEKELVRCPVDDMEKRSALRWTSRKIELAPQDKQHQM